MSRIVLVTGGARSGKSRYAEARAEGLAAAGGRLYLATCVDPGPADPEMAARIQRHRDTRGGRGWRTVEEPLAVAGVIRSAVEPVVLLDCVTLWVANLLEHRGLDEDGVAAAAAELAGAGRAHPGDTVFLVTNEVGCGVVPANDLARRFRDCVGRANQVLGAAAQEVVLVACGQPLVVKSDSC